MKVLYLNTDRWPDRSDEFREINKYDVVESISFDDALRLLKATHFDVLVTDDRGNPDTVQFIADVRAVRPHLPVFVISAWGADLATALSSIAAVEELTTGY